MLSAIQDGAPGGNSGTGPLVSHTGMGGGSEVVGYCMSASLGWNQTCAGWRVLTSLSRTRVDRTRLASPPGPTAYVVQHPDLV
eukprot:4634532-Pyramimonas_sp.AAC.1